MAHLAPSSLGTALTALGIEETHANDKGWITIMCPACTVNGAKGASLRVNVNSGQYKCFRCLASSETMALDVFAGHPTSPTMGAVTPNVKGAKGTSKIPELSDELVARYHRFLMDSPSVVQDIERKRGWTEETLRTLMIGWDGSHMWIPIRDEVGQLVNVRLYDAFKNTKLKSYHYVNSTGLRRTSVWVPIPEQLEKVETYWMFEGEPDGILAAQLGFPVLLVTGGAGTWCEDLVKVIGKKKVVIFYDPDAAGERGAKAIFSRLKANGINEVLIMRHRPEDGSKDFTDLVVKDGRNVGWFKARAKAQWEGRAEDPEGTDGPPPIRVRLGDGVPGEPILLRAQVLGSHTVPILVPATAYAKCEKNWQPDKACKTCPVGLKEGKAKIDIDAESEELAILCVTRLMSRDIELRKLSGAPLRCPMVVHEVGSMWQVQHVKLIPPMTERMGGENTIRSAMCVAQADGRPMPVRANQLYDFAGKVVPDVLTNEWTLMSSESRPAEDDIDSFRLSTELVTDLRRHFSPDEWTVEGLSQKMLTEERSVARHVTKVYGRETLLRLVDLTYHSVLRFSFKDRTDQRGWMSLLVFGDTRTGKSETMATFNNYIGLGKFIMDPANTTYAGLVGGLQQVGKSDKAWTITWGLIPTNDRGLVIVDEVSSLPVADIGKMSGMRSSGVAELTKIRSASTPARTRLIMSGNPRGLGRSLSTFGTPIEGVMDLIGAPEDIARFDCAIGVKQGLDKDKANRELGEQPEPAPIGLRRALVKFAWSRGNDQVAWEPGAEDMCMEIGADMAKRYHHSIPFVEPSEQDMRIARIAVAAAARSFSVANDDPNVVLVRRCHVEFAARTMEDAYQGDIGYADYSDFLKRQDIQVEPIVKALTSVQRDVAKTCRALLSIKRVTPNSIGMATALDGSEARRFIATMTQCGAAVFDFENNRNTAMTWTPAFITLLRKFEVNPPKVEESDMF